MLSLLFVCTAVLALGIASASADKYGKLTYSVSDDGQVTITGCNEDATEIIIPSTLGGYPVTEIGSSAFAECYALKSVIIANGVTAIGDRAFRWCNSLKKHNYPQ